VIARRLAASALVVMAAGFAGPASAQACRPLPVVEACVPDQSVQSPNGVPSAQQERPEVKAPAVTGQGGDPKAAYVASGAASFVEEAASRLGADGVDLGSEALARDYRTLAALGLFLLAPFLLIAAIQAVVRADAGTLGRTLLGRLPLAVVVTVGALTLVQLGVTLAAEMTRTWLAGPGHALPSDLAHLAAATRAAPGGADPFAVTVASALVAVGAVLVWMELALRDVALYACVLFLPLAMAGVVWPAAVTWARRLAACMVAVVFAGFFLVVSLTAGFAVARTGRSSLDGLLLGAGVLLVAAAVPFGVARLLLRLDSGQVRARRPDVRSGSPADPGATYLRVIESRPATSASATVLATTTASGAGLVMAPAPGRVALRVPEVPSEEPGDVTAEDGGEP